MARQAAATTPKNFHDSIRNMFTGGASSANSTNSLAYTLETSVNATEDLLDMQRKHNNLALKIMQEQTKLLKKIAANDNGIGITDVAGVLLFRRMLSRVFGGRIATLLSGGIGGALATTITGIGRKIGSVITTNIGSHVAKAFSAVAAVGKSFKSLSGIANAVTSSGVMKMVSGLSLGSFKLIPRLLGKLFLPLTAIMGIADAFSGWGNAESILGKSNVGIGDRVASAIGSALNGLLLGIPDWLVAKLGGGNVSQLLASGKDLAVSGFSKLGKGIGSLIGSAISSIPNLLPSAAGLLSGAATYVTDKVYGTFEHVKNAIWDGLTNLGKMIKESITGVFTDTWDSVKNWWNSDSGSSAPSFRRSINAGNAAQAVAASGATIGAMVNSGITPGASSSSTTPSSSNASNGASYTSPATLSNTEGGFGGALGELVSIGESKAAGGYNAYNRGTSGGKILGSVGPQDLENMTLGEIRRRQALPISDQNRLFAVGKYQMIPDTLQEAMTKYNLDPNQKFDKNTQEKLFRDYLVGSKRPNIKKYIMGGGDKNAAIESLAYEFASFADTSGRGKYGSGNSAHIGPKTSGKVLDQMRATYAQSIAAGDNADVAYAKAFGAGPAANSNKLVSTAPAYTGQYTGYGPGMEIVDRFKERGEDKVDPRLRDILNKAAMDPEIAEKYRVEAYSGLRPGDTGRHGSGMAADIRLIDKVTGKTLKNYQDAEDFREYEKFAQKAKLIQQRDYPDLEKQFRWGGYFSGAKEGTPGGKYGALDSMHFDFTKGAAMGGGSWEKGLNAQQRRYFPGVQSEGIYSTKLVAPTPMIGDLSGQLKATGYDGSRPTPTTGSFGDSKVAKPFRSPMLGTDLAYGNQSIPDLSGQLIAPNYAGGPTPSKKPTPSFDSLIDKKTANYKVPVTNPQTGAGSADSSGNKPTAGPVNPGSHSVTDIPVTDEYKMLLANGSAIT